MLKKWIFITLIFCSSMAMAATTNLVKITGDQDKDYYYIYVKTDSLGVITEFGKKEYKKGKLFKVEKFPADLSDGVVMKEAQGRKVVILRGLNTSPKFGGELDLDYLYNGVTHSRRYFRLQLEKVNDKWSLLVKNKVIEHLHFRANRVIFLGVVGIKRVVVVK